MAPTARYLSHPEVEIDFNKKVQNWSLSDRGRARTKALARSKALLGTTRVITSAETKAIETATPLASALGCDVEISEAMHENDRSATGALPPDEFEQVADQFFAQPHASVRGWETAIAAQKRIVGEVNACLDDHKEGDVLFVGHGGVGTLLYCALLNLPISRAHDQKPGGGCFYPFEIGTMRPQRAWQPMEALLDQP
ncbi:MAG: histidine phosphatase family protein [Devosiaceae bacterium]